MEKVHNAKSDDPEKMTGMSPKATSFEDGENKGVTFIHVDPNDGDEALKAFEGQEAIVMTEEMERNLLRKIDWNLMPMLCVVYGLNYLDKTTLSYASIMGMQSAIHLHGTNYQWLGSMFYIGYLAWEYPTNRFLQRLPLAKWSAFNIIMWGGTLCCMAAVENFAGAVAVRFFLGVFEAAVTPGFALFTSQWYTRKEQGTRTGIWFSFNGFAQIFGGLVAYGISTGVKKHGAGIDSWQIVFLTIGLITVMVGCIFLYFMPDNQLNAKFLTPQERIMAIERIRKNQQGVGNKHFKMYQFKEALTDPMTWAFVFFALVADIPNGGISNFFSQLIVSFGYTPDQSLLYGTPGGAVEVVFLIVCGYLGDKFGRRVLVGMSGMITSIVGMLLIVCLPFSNPSGRLAGYYLTQSSPTGFVALLSLISSNVAGYTKKTTVGALYLIAYCTGNIIGPQTFRPEDKPRYIPAEITIIVCYAVCTLDLAFIHWYYVRRNKMNEGVRAQPGYRKLDKQEFLDLTDRENPEFVYTL
ncbi:MFS allantoate transporter-like protein [Leptodontidium sp. 2 PMI_412]|nr:MFS allantoate transporter-like protein [Leptodontidium sp. 2 PMI_412]